MADDDADPMLGSGGTVSSVLRAARAAVAGYGDVGAAGLRREARRLGTHGLRKAPRGGAEREPRPAAGAYARGAGAARGTARPETPRGHGDERQLFSGSSEYSYRPSSSYGAKPGGRGGGGEGGGSGFAAFGYAGFEFAHADESAAELARCVARDRSAAALAEASERLATSPPMDYERPRSSRGRSSEGPRREGLMAEAQVMGVGGGPRSGSAGTIGMATARGGSAGSMGSGGTASPPDSPGTPLEAHPHAPMVPRPPSARAPRPPSARGRPGSGRPGSARPRPRPGSGAANVQPKPRKAPPPTVEHVVVGDAPAPAPPEAPPAPARAPDEPGLASGGNATRDEWSSSLMAAASAVQAHLRQPASSSESADAAGGGDAGAAMAGDQEGLHALVALTSVAAIDCLQDVAELNAVLERGRIRLRAPLLVERERQAALSALFRAMDTAATAVGGGAARTGNTDIGGAGAATAALLQARAARGALHVLLPPLMGGAGAQAAAVDSEGLLLHVFRSLYRLSKDSANDAVFAAEGLLHPTLAILAEATSSAAEAASAAAAAGARNAAATPAELLVYVAGAMKNASADAANAAALADAGAVMTLCRLVAATAAATGERRGSEAAAQLLVQVTGTLRNLSVEAAHARLFAEAGAASALADCVAAFAPYGELMRNVSRVASKLTSHSASRAEMEEDERTATAMIAAIAAHPSDDALVLRAAFALGNVTACSERCRVAAVSTKGAVEALARTMASYRAIAAPPPPLHLLGGGAAEEAPHAPLKMDARRAGALDVLVKLVRVIGNLAISPEAATQLVASRLLAGTFLALLSEHSVDDSEELVLNVVSTISNLTFYEGAKDNHILLGRRVLVGCLSPLLLCGKEDAVAEAARCFGNLSRYADVRQEMAARRVDAALCILLDHSNSAVLYSAAGVLMNIAADEAHRDELSQHDNVGRVVDALAHALYGGEASLAVILLKALFNLCAADAAKSRRAVLTPAQAAVARDAIADYLSTGGMHGDGSGGDAEEAEEEALADALGMASQMSRLLQDLPLVEQEEGEAAADGASSDSSGSLEELVAPPPAAAAQ